MLKPNMYEIFQQKGLHWSISTSIFRPPMPKGSNYPREWAMVLLKYLWTMGKNGLPGENKTVLFREWYPLKGISSKQMQWLSASWKKTSTSSLRIFQNPNDVNNDWRNFYPKRRMKFFQIWMKTIWNLSSKPIQTTSQQCHQRGSKNPLRPCTSRSNPQSHQNRPIHSEIFYS